jgi:hypothetical protein
MPSASGLATLTRQRSMNTKRATRVRFHFPRRVYNDFTSGSFVAPLWNRIEVVG